MPDRRLLIVATLALSALLGGCRAATVEGGNPLDECTYAAKPDELAVCHDPHLRQQDIRLSMAFNRAQHTSDSVGDDDLFDQPMMGAGLGGPRRFYRRPGVNIEIQSRRLTFLQRRAQCGGNTGCIGRLYDQELRYLDWRYGPTYY